MDTHAFRERYLDPLLADASPGARALADGFERLELEGPELERGHPRPDTQADVESWSSPAQVRIGAVVGVRARIERVGLRISNDQPASLEAGWREVAVGIVDWLERLAQYYPKG